MAGSSKSVVDEVAVDKVVDKVCSREAVSCDIVYLFRAFDPVFCVPCVRKPVQMTTHIKGIAIEDLEGMAGDANGVSALALYPVSGAAAAGRITKITELCSSVVDAYIQATSEGADIATVTRLLEVWVACRPSLVAVVRTLRLTSHIRRCNCGAECLE
jgi:hypothetical protein